MDIHQISQIRVFFNGDFFKSYFSSMIIEADLELIKDTSASEDIESHSKALGEPYRGNYFIITNLQRKVVKICGNKTPVPNNDHLATSFYPVNAYTPSIIYTQNAEGCS